MSDALFVERRFELKPKGEVVVQLFQPAPEPNGDAWRCTYQIDWPNRQRRFYLVGVDGMQALMLAMKIVHTELLTSPEGKAGSLTWLGSSDLGLPD